MIILAGKYVFLKWPLPFKDMGNEGVAAVCCIRLFIREWLPRFDGICEGILIGSGLVGDVALSFILASDYYVTEVTVCIFL